MIDVQVRAEDLTQLVRALRRIEDGKDLRKRLRQDIRDAAKPMIPAIRSKVRSLPSKGESKRRGRPQLRASIARATRLQIQMSGRWAGVTVRVDPKKMPPGMHNLPAYLEGMEPFGRWRHPVFGRDVYVGQRPKPYFYAIANRYVEPVQRATAEALDSIRRQIESS